MCLNSTLDHQCSPILFCLLCWCTILNKNTTYSFGFIINISDHVSNQRLYLKVMLRCTNIYHNQSVKPCIKNCLNLLISDIAFTDALTYIDHLYLIFQKDWRHFFPWKKNAQKISRNRKFDLMHPESAIKPVYYSLPLLIRLQYTLPLYIPVIKQLLSTHTQNVL